MRSGLAMGFALLVLCGSSRLVWPASFCQDCYKKTSNDGPYTQAQCCISDSCPFEDDSDWDNVIYNSFYCRVDWVNGEGWECRGESFSCDEGGGGTGGGGSGGGMCSIGPGALCPAECFSCDRNPFLN